MTTRTPEELIEVCLSNAETLVALDHEGAYIGRGAVRSFEMDFREAAAALTEALTRSSHAYTGEALDQLTEARQERDRLREALEGAQSPARSRCWCDYSHNTMAYGHQAKCVLARAALSGGDSLPAIMNCEACRDARVVPVWDSARVEDWHQQTCPVCSGGSVPKEER